MKWLQVFISMIGFFFSFLLLAGEANTDQSHVKKPQKFSEETEKIWGKKILALEEKRNKKSKENKGSKEKKPKRDFKKEFSVLVSSLKKGDHQAKIKAINDLHVLYYDGIVSRNDIRRADIVPLIISLLRERSTDRKSQLIIIELVGDFSCSDKSNQDLVRESGGIESFTFFLQNHHIKLKLEAVTALHLLAKDNEANKEAILSAVPLLVEAMNLPCKGVRSLKSYKQDFDKNGKLLQLPNGHITFIPQEEFSIAGPRGRDRLHDDLREAIALLFAHLADGNKKNQIAIREAGAIPLLIVAINLCSRSIGFSVLALKNLVEDNIENKNILLLNKSIGSLLLQLYNIHGLELEENILEIIWGIIKLENLPPQKAIPILKGVLKWASKYSKHSLAKEIIKKLRERAKSSPEQKKIIKERELVTFVESLLKGVSHGFIARERYLLKLESISFLKMFDAFKKKKPKKAEKKDDKEKEKEGGKSEEKEITVSAE